MVDDEEDADEDEQDADEDEEDAEEDADEDEHYETIIQYEGDNECSNNEVTEEEQ